jgi:CheY-like chemotaxis protein
LLADDSVTIQRVIELTFADEDVRVTAVGDGQQAIDRIVAEPPDIVLADVGMPERDGYEVAAFIKERPELAHIPVLLLTGAFEPVDEVRARQVRCDGVLAKPFEPQLLIARVKELLGRPAEDAPAPAIAEPETHAQPPVADDDLVLDPRQLLEGAPPRSADAEGSLDDYFDRLDQAFANLAGTAAPARPSAPRPAVEPAWAAPLPPAVPWPSEETLQVHDRAATPAAVSPAAPAVLTVPVADAFAALLGAESSGEVPPQDGAPAAVLVAAPAPADESPYAFPAYASEPAGEPSDSLEVIVERVIERLGLQPGQIAEKVAEVAERLVREEIERLKAVR